MMSAADSISSVFSREDIPTNRASIEALRSNPNSSPKISSVSRRLRICQLTLSNVESKHFHSQLSLPVFAAAIVIVFVSLFVIGSGTGKAHFVKTIEPSMRRSCFISSEKKWSYRPMISHAQFGSASGHLKPPYWLSAIVVCLVKHSAVSCSGLN